RGLSPAGTVRAPGSQPSAKSSAPSTPEATAPTTGGQDASKSGSGVRRSFTPPASTTQPSATQPSPSGVPETNAGTGTAQSPAAQPGSASGPTAGGAAQSKDGLHPAQRDPEPAQAQQDENEQEQRAGSGLPGGGSEAAPSDGDGKAGGSVLALSPGEIEKIRRVIASYSIAPPERAKFQMRIGALVPDNVDLKPIPPELKDVIPDHQNFSYIRTPGQIAIVITGKREIDLLIPA